MVVWNRTCSIYKVCLYLWPGLCSVQARGMRRGPGLQVPICPGLIVKAKALGAKEQHHVFVTTGVMQLQWEEDTCKIHSLEIFFVHCFFGFSLFNQNDFMRNPDWLYNCFTLGNLWMFIRNHRENVFSRETMDLITRSTVCRYAPGTVNRSVF